MRYAVFTTRHHDGYAMWPTAYSDYSVATSPCGRDLVGEFVEAFRDAGLRIGLYYSLPDWHHPDYPALTDADRPYSFGMARRPSAEQWDRYVAYVFGQIDSHGGPELAHGHRRRIDPMVAADLVGDALG